MTRNNNCNEKLIAQNTVSDLPQFRARVLVVEDDTVNQKVARGMLNKFGLQIDLAEHGQVAINILEQQPYDLVFMDCYMPVMDGYEATRHIRDPHSKVKNHIIPIIAMTANVMPTSSERCLSEGMNDFVAKPVDILKLRSALEQWLPESCQQNKVQKASNEKESTLSTNQDNHSSESIFNYATLHKRLMGDEELIRDITQSFLDDMPLQIKQLKARVEADDVQQIVAQAHKIKGAAANVAALNFSLQAEYIESAAKATDLKAIQHVLPKLEQYFEQLKLAMMAVRP